MKILKSLSKILDKILQVAVFILITGMIVTVSLQIIARVFFTALSWTEEMSRYLLVWGSFLGASLAYHRGAHIAVTFVLERLSTGARRWTVFVAHLFSLVFFILGFWYGIEMIKMQVFQVSPSLNLPMKDVYLVIPISFGFMVYFGFVNVLDIILKEGE